MSEIVPFGKYKGQPLEALAEDQGYLEWLRAQPWFQARYPNLHTIVINNFREPSETPEHNRLQARFLDADFQRRVFTLCFPGLTGWVDRRYRELLVEGIKELQAKLEAATRRLISAEAYPHDEKHKESCEKRVQVLMDGIAKVAPPGRWAWRLGVEFETEGADVLLSADAAGLLPFQWEPDQEVRWTEDIFTSRELRIELKPLLGDDYPAVLRQMRASKSTVLVVDEFRSAAVDIDQLRQIYDTAGCKVITLDQIETIE